ncbi:hypothetical protein Tco_1010768 [Tanacetum coccineum]
MGDTIAQTRFENVSTKSYNPLLARGNTLQSGEDSLRLKELMELCTNLQQIVLDLEKTKTTQAEEIVSLKRRVKKLEQKKRSRTYKLKRLRNVGATARVESSGDEESLVSVAGDKVSTIGAATTVSIATITTATTVEEITLAQALADLKSTKPIVKGIAFKEPGESTTPIPLKILDKAKIDKEKRIARTKEEMIDEANITWDDIQAKVDAGYKKHFAAKRAEEKRNKPPTKTQQKKTMITYLKNMEGWKHKDFKSKDFDSIKELFDKALKRVNMFVDFTTELAEGSSKRVCTKLEQEVTKKKKVDNDQEAAKIKELMEIVLNKEEVAIDAILLAVKRPSIVDWKNHTKGKKTYYQIIRADGKSQMYLVFSHMLKRFDREDLETLWILVKAKHGSTRPKEGYERVL